MEYGVDFSHYRPDTVGRRIQRRLEINRDLDLPAYVDRLRGDQGELNSLYRDLLIGVTKSFRDQDAYARLDREVLPHLIAAKPRDEDLRHVPMVMGCVQRLRRDVLAGCIAQCTGPQRSAQV